MCGDTVIVMASATEIAELTGGGGYEPDMPSRSIGDLTSPEILRSLRASSILCMPIGSIEQHGPHLPLNTDAVLAEEFTRRIISVGAKSSIYGNCHH